MVLQAHLQENIFDEEVGFLNNDLDAINSKFWSLMLKALKTNQWLLGYFIQLVMVKLNVWNVILKYLFSSCVFFW